MEADVEVQGLLCAEVYVYALIVFVGCGALLQA